METTIRFTVGHQGTLSFAKLRITEARNTNPSTEPSLKKHHLGKRAGLRLHRTSMRKERRKLKAVDCDEWKRV